MTVTNNTSWQDAPAKSREICDAVVAVTRALWNDDAPRRLKMLSAISRNECMTYTSLDPSAYQSGLDLANDNGVKLRWNVTHSIIASAIAQIAGTQQPKVRAISSNADWATRRKGRKLDQFIMGLWSVRRGIYDDIWSLCGDVLRDAATCDVGYVLTEVDAKAMTVNDYRVSPWEVLVDPQDARDGAPICLYRRRRSTKAEQIASHPDSESEIKNAGGEIEDTQDVDMARYVASSGYPTVDPIIVYEWWKLPLSEDTPGRHVKCIANHVLVDEEWTRQSFPLAPLWWEKSAIGWSGVSLASTVETIDDSLNEILGRVIDVVRRTAIGTKYVRNGTTDSTTIADEDCMVVNFDGVEPGIKYEAPEPVSQVHLELLKILEDAAYRFSGISQATATAQKQPGIEAGVAIRMVADMQSQRLSMALKAFQMLFVQIARNQIAAIRELAKEDKQFSVRWAGSGFLKTIDWASVDLDDDKFVLQLDRAPGIKDTPADRAQSAKDYFADGLISQDALMSVLTYLDLPTEVERSSQQRNIVDGYIEQWLDATEEEIASNTTSDGRELFSPPISWMPRLENALLQVADAYIQARFDGAPDENCRLFLRWIEMADAEIVKRAQRMTAIQQSMPTGAKAPMQGQM